MDIILQLAQELNLKKEQVEKTVALLDEGSTVPFIARYRKEVTGSLDDTVLRTLSERLDYLRSLDKRREEVYNAIVAQEKMTPEIEAALSAAKILTEIEDIYRPSRALWQDYWCSWFGSYWCHGSKYCRCIGNECSRVRSVHFCRCCMEAFQKCKKVFGFGYNGI